ncbi:hypothetical protein C8Q75DRAFT_737700 [Abortiporus biennis]|nr:hypothetical protein C8Q75DRAFT_737700 [Abortiporus biennis]
MRPQHTARIKYTCPRRASEITSIVLSGIVVQNPNLLDSIQMVFLNLTVIMDQLVKLVEYHNQQFEYAEYERNQVEESRSKSFREFLVEVEQSWSQKQLEIGKELDEWNTKLLEQSRGAELTRERIFQTRLDKRAQTFADEHERRGFSFEEIQRGYREEAELSNKQRVELCAQSINFLQKTFSNLLDEEDMVYREQEKRRDSEFRSAIDDGRLKIKKQHPTMGELHGNTNTRVQESVQPECPSSNSSDPEDTSPPRPLRQRVSSKLQNERPTSCPEASAPLSESPPNQDLSMTTVIAVPESKSQASLSIDYCGTFDPVAPVPPSQASQSATVISSTNHSDMNTEPSQSLAALANRLRVLTASAQSMFSSLSLETSAVDTQDQLHRLCEAVFSRSQLCRQTKFQDLQSLRTQIFDESQSYMNTLACSQRSGQFLDLYSTYQERFIQDLSRRTSQNRDMDRHLDTVEEEREMRFEWSQRDQAARYTKQQRSFTARFSAIDRNANRVLRKAGDQLAQLFCSFDDKFASVLKRMEVEFDIAQEMRRRKLESTCGLNESGHGRSTHNESNTLVLQHEVLQKFFQSLLSSKHRATNRNGSHPVRREKILQSDHMEPETSFTPRILISKIQQLFSARSKIPSRPTSQPLMKMLSPLQLGAFLDTYTQKYDQSSQLREDDFDALQQTHSRRHTLAEMKRSQLYESSISEFKSTSQKRVIEWSNRCAEIQGEWAAVHSVGEARRTSKFHDAERKREDVFLEGEEDRSNQWEVRLKKFQTWRIDKEDSREKKFVEWKEKIELEFERKMKEWRDIFKKLNDEFAVQFAGLMLGYATMT